MVDATTSAAVETGLPPVMIPLLPLRRQPLAAEIASQRDAPTVDVGVVADVVAARVVDAVVEEAKDVRTVIL